MLVVALGGYKAALRSREHFLDRGNEDVSRDDLLCWQRMARPETTSLRVSGLGLTACMAQIRGTSRPWLTDCVIV